MEYSTENSMKEIDQILTQLHQKPFVQNALSIDSSLKENLQSVLQEAADKNAPDFADPSVSEIFRVPVVDGTIRVIHYLPSKPISKRPVVFLPGWGVVPRGFQDFFEVLYGKTELYYIETREKQTSQIKRFGSDFSLSQKAKDVQEVIKYAGLDQRDFVLMGTCWGSAVILHGLIDGTIEAPTYVVVDPMHRLSYPKAILDAAPVLPIWLLYLFKPLLKYLKIRNMKAKKQKQRASDFIDNAVLWKWKKAGYHCRNYELFGRAREITQEVFIFNGTTDLIHDQRNYPLIAREMPNGRFFYMETTEDKRERLMGVIGKEFSQQTAKQPVSNYIGQFERDIPRIIK